MSDSSLDLECHEEFEMVSIKALLTHIKEIESKVPFEQALNERLADLTMMRCPSRNKEHYQSLRNIQFAMNEQLVDCTDDATHKALEKIIKLLRKVRILFSRI